MTRSIDHGRGDPFFKRLTAQRSARRRAMQALVAVRLDLELSAAVTARRALISYVGGYFGHIMETSNVVIFFRFRDEIVSAATIFVARREGWGRIPAKSGLIRNDWREFARMPRKA